MTIASQTSRISYTGDGSTATFPIPFYFQANADIVVMLQNNSGIQTTKVLGTDYSLSGAGNPAGGSLTFTVAPTALTGTVIAIYRDPLVTQTTSYNNNDPFPAKSHELALDKATTVDQRTRDLVSRSIHLADSEIGSNTVLASLPTRKNKLLGFGTNGDLIYVSVPPTVPGQDAAGVFIADTRATAQVRNFDISINNIITGGYSVPGDGGRAFYTRTISSTPGGFQSADGAWWQLTEDEPNILQFGGSDDGATFNDAAWALAKASLLANTRTLRFPHVGSGIYNFNPASGGINTSGVVIRADAGVVLKGPIAFDPSSKSDSDITVSYTDNAGLAFNGFGFTPKFNRPARDKEAWLAGALERKSLTGYDMTTVGCATTDFTTGDVWTTDGSVATTADTVTVSLANDGKIRGAQFVSVRGGDEVSASFALGNYVKAAIVRFAGGWHAFYANTSQALFRVKLTGVSGADSSPLSWFGLATDPAWAPDKADWKIRIYNSKTYSILFNGMEILEQENTPGPIYDAGFAMVGVASLTASWSYLARVRRSEAAGRSPARVLVCGDSTSADIAGGWPYYMKELLEGSYGIRVWDVFNQAVSGHTSGQQLTALNANDAQLTQSTHVVIFIGINDDQASGPSTTITNIAAMIDRCVSRGINVSRIILCVPYLWYTQALAGGIGVNTSFNDRHGPLRAAIRRLAGIKACRLVDLQEVLAAIQPSDLGVPGRDAQLRDNIHPTLFSYRKIGHAIAREIMAATAIEMTQQESLTAFHSTWLSNSWTKDATSPASYSVSKEGVVNLSGLLNAGTISSPIVIGNLPVNLRPSQVMEFDCVSNLTSSSLTSALFVGTNGNLTLVNFPASGAAYISLANVSFQLPTT